MKRTTTFSALTGILAFAVAANAQISMDTSTSFAPANFGNSVLTSLPSNATSSTGVSSIFGANGATFNFGTGGTLVNPAAFSYTLTGPNTATITTAASGDTPASTTNLTFTSANSGDYVTTSGGETTTGSFTLSQIPSAPPLANVSVRTPVMGTQPVTVGFVVGGAMPRRVLVRAIGPGLSSFGVNGSLANPSLQLFHGSQMLATNDDWGTAATVSSGSGTSGGSGTGTGSTGTGTDTGGGTATGSGAGGTGTSGTASGSDTGATGAGETGSGTDTGGMGAGSASTVTSSLATTQMFTQLGAFGLTSNSRDAAIVVTLPPGPYTVNVQSSTAATDTGSGTVTGGAGTGTVGTGNGGTGMGGTTTGAGTGGMGTGTGTGTSATTTSGEVLIEVYFVD